MCWQSGTTYRIVLCQGIAMYVYWSYKRKTIGMWRSSNSNVVELRTFLTHSKSVEFYCDFSAVSNGVRKVDGWDRKSHNTVLCGRRRTTRRRSRSPSVVLFDPTPQSSLPGRISSRPTEAWLEFVNTHTRHQPPVNQHIIIAVRWRA